MINFKDPKDQTPSALAVLGMVLIAGAVVVSVFFNRSEAKGYASKARKDQANFSQRTLVAKSDFSVYQYSIEKYQWNEKEDLVTPAALNIIGKRSEENRLKLVSFRPLKSYEGGSLVQLPMQFTVDGSFANVAAMLESLEKSDSKLAIQQVQFASQEGGTDQVSANVGLVALLGKPAPTKKGTTKVSVPNAPASTTQSPTGVNP